MNDRLTRYPRSAGLEEVEVQLRVMTADDENAVAAFANALPPHDLLFLRRVAGPAAGLVDLGTAFLGRSAR